MGTIGIFDYDYFNYESVIPNLECAKLCAYFKKNKEVTVLAPVMEPHRYTNFYIRKDYEDGIYPKDFFLDNVSYGGRAVSPIYKPLDIEIEKSIPDFSGYLQYQNLYGSKRNDKEQIKRILGSAHFRLSLDEENIESFIKHQSYLERTHKGIILHDYNLSKVSGAYDFIKGLSESRYTIQGEKPKPYPIGNKYPIQVSTEEDLMKWLNITPMTDVFFLQYNGIMSNETLLKLVEENNRIMRQVWYRIDDGWFSENDFIKSALPKIYKQVLFLKNHKTKILLKYNDDFITTPELQNTIHLFNNFLNSDHEVRDKKFLHQTTLYNYCRGAKEIENFCIRNYIKSKPKLSTQDKRDVFQFIREKNYDVFHMFYEWYKVKYDKGDFINDKS